MPVMSEYGGGGLAMWVFIGWDGFYSGHRASGRIQQNTVHGINKKAILKMLF